METNLIGSIICWVVGGFGVLSAIAVPWTTRRYSTAKSYPAGAKPPDCKPLDAMVVSTMIAIGLIPNVGAHFWWYFLVPSAVLPGFAWIRRDSLARMVRAMSSEDARVRLTFAVRLADWRDQRGLVELNSALRNADPLIRVSAVKVLSRLGELNVGRLEQVLKDPDASVRRAAIATLKEIDKDEAVGLLAAALADADLEVREASVAALESYAWQPTEPVQQIRFAIARGRYVEAAGHGAAASEFLVQALRDTNSELSRRAEILSALGMTRDGRALKLLVKALQNEDISIRIAAAKALGSLNDPRASGHLVTVLHENATELQGLRYTAACSLGKIGDCEAVVPLLEAARNTYTRDSNALLVNRLGSSAIPPLVMALNQADLSVRIEAVRLFSKLDRVIVAGCFDNLHTAMYDGPTEMQAEIAKVLIEKDLLPADPRKCATILVKARDWERASVLGAVAVEPLLSALADPTNEQRARHAILSIGEHALEPLAVVVLGNDSVMRVRAIGLLDAFRNAVAIEPLSAALSAEDPESRLQAVDALARIFDERIAGPLGLAIKDPVIEVRRRAVSALAQAGFREVLPFLSGTIHDPDPEVRRISCEAVAPLTEQCASADRSDWRYVRREDLLKMGRIALQPLWAELNTGTDARWQACHQLMTIGDPLAVESFLTIHRDESGECGCGESGVEFLSKFLNQFARQTPVEVLQKLTSFQAYMTIDTSDQFSTWPELMREKVWVNTYSVQTLAKEELTRRGFLAEKTR